jgi:hypothetical protein
MIDIVIICFVKKKWGRERWKPFDAGQNSDYFVGYSIGSLQGKNQRKLSQKCRDNLWTSIKLSIISDAGKRPQPGLI